MVEERRPLEKPHHRYQISQYGRIRYGNNSPRKKEMSWQRDRQRAVTATIRLLQSKKSIKINIARAVYRLYIGEIPVWMEVIHKDWNRWNNHIDNLILWNDRDTNFNAFINWLNKLTPPIKKRNISNKVCNKVSKEYNKWNTTQTKLAKKYKLSQSSINRIINKYT